MSKSNAIVDRNIVTDVESGHSRPASLPSDYESSEHYQSEGTQSNFRSVVTVPQPQHTIPDTVTGGAGTSAAPEVVEALPSDILEVLGESKEKDEVFGPRIREEISKRWGKIIMEGLGKEQKQKLFNNTLIPENFQLVKAPKLNQEISSVLTESARNRDKRLEWTQNHLGIGIAGITNLLSSVIDGNLEKAEIIKKLSETAQILLDLHCQNTANRRKLVTFSLDKKFLNIIQGVKRDTFLFGENLGEKIKASKMAEKSGLQIRRTEPQPSTSHRATRSNNYRQGNSRRPLRHQNYRGRSSGHRTQASNSNTGRYPAPAGRYSSAKTAPKAPPKPD